MTTLRGASICRRRAILEFATSAKRTDRCQISAISSNATNRSVRITTCAGLIGSKNKTMKSTSAVTAASTSRPNTNYACPANGSFLVPKRTPAGHPRKTKVAESKPEYVVGAPDPRPRKDDDSDVFYVYLLLLDDGSYYAGQTRELGPRYLEHTSGQTKSTKGKNPKLVWFTRVRTREEAREYEKFLNRLRKDNVRAITRMIDEFLVLIDHVHNPRKKPAN